MHPLPRMQAAEAMTYHFSTTENMLLHRFSIIKNYIRAAWITGFFAAFVIYLPTEQRANNINPDLVYGISYASVQTDILQPSSIDGLKEIHGVKIAYYDQSKVAYFFEYEANALDTLKVVGLLPFTLDNNASSVACTLLESNSNPLEVNTAFSERVREATSFFWNSQAADYTFYECIKSPLKHTLMISKTSSRILHKVESI